MTRQTTINLTDARDVDGDPYEAAGVAVENVKAALAAAAQTLDVLYALARNAEMQRALDFNNPLLPEHWPDSPHARKLNDLSGRVLDLQAELDVLKRAVTFNPLALDDET